MNFRKTTLLIAFLAIFATAAFAGDVDMNRLNRSIPKFKTYHYGQDRLDISKIETQVAMASKDAVLRGKVEQMIIDTLAEAETKDAKQFLCRQLRTIGTVKCVALLESMLTDAEISHLARNVLVRIEDPKAGAALVRAMGKTSGDLKVGMISSIAESNYRPGLPDITKLVNAGDKQVAAAAVNALGRFGGSASVETLGMARRSADEAMKVEIDASLLNCAEKFAADGNKDDARNIYREYYLEKYSEQLRIAGLRGLVTVDGDKALDVLVDAITGSDHDLSGSAVAMMGELKGGKVTETFVKLFKTLTPDGQELVIRVFESRGDPAVAPLIIEAAGSKYENVRIAALIALGGVSTPESIGTLVKTASTGTKEEKDIAKRSLAGMKGEGADKAFIGAMKSGDDRSRIEVIRALGSRGISQAIPVLLEVAKTNEQSAVRRDAIVLMGVIGAESDIETLIELAIKPCTPGDRLSIERAVVTIFNKVEDKDTQARPVIAAIKIAPEEAKPVLLSLLKRSATAEALETVRGAAKSKNELVSNAAIRSMLDWPNAAPSEDIYQIAATSDNQVHRVLALRSYVRLARLSAQPAAMYAKAMKIAKRGDEIKQILGGLGFDDSLESYDLASQYFDKDEFKTDAYLAAVKIMSKYCRQNPEKGKTELQRIARNAPNDDIRNRARKAIEDMEVKIN